jgi:hypothetical protein
MQIAILKIVLMQNLTMYKQRSHNTTLYCYNSYGMNLDRVTDSHVELNVLDDMQEFLSNGIHKISFDYDEDTAKSKILKQESSVTICTVDTIDTI